MVDFQANELRYKGKTYSVNLKLIVCDAIARQFVKQTIGALWLNLKITKLNV